MKPSSETRRIGTDQDFIGFYARIEESLPSNTIVLDISIKSVYVFFFFYVVAKHREEKKKFQIFSHVYKYPYLRTVRFYVPRVTSKKFFYACYVRGTMLDILKSRRMKRIKVTPLVISARDGKQKGKRKTRSEKNGTHLGYPSTIEHVLAVKL